MSSIVLNDMNSNPKIIYPLRGKVKHICEKIFILLQGKLSNIQIPNWNLANDADHAFVIAQRIIRCITELAFIQNYSSSALAASYQL